MADRKFATEWVALRSSSFHVLSERKEVMCPCLCLLYVFQVGIGAFEFRVLMCWCGGVLECVLVLREFVCACRDLCVCRRWLLTAVARQRRGSGACSCPRPCLNASVCLSRRYECVCVCCVSANVWLPVHLVKGHVFIIVECCDLCVCLLRVCREEETQLVNCFVARFKPKKILNNIVLCEECIYENMYSGLMKIE